MQLPETETNRNAYYVYVKGHLQEVTTQVNQAVIDADAGAGVVLDARQRYVWERGNYPDTSKIEASKVNPWLLPVTADEKRFRQNIPDDFEFMNFSGCSMDSVKYPLSRGYPVAARLSAGEDVLILGYDLYNIWIYDEEAENGMKAIASDDAEAAFAAMGNIFLSFREK